MTVFPEYAMRRADRALSEEESRKILENGEYGHMATIGEDGFPYGIPLSYVLDGDTIYFHCALEGRKLRNISHFPQVCFTVVGKVQAAYAHGFTTWFESAIIFGTVRRIDDEQEKYRILHALAKKYLPDHVAAHAEQDIARSHAITGVYGIHIEQLTGKAKRQKH